MMRKDFLAYTFLLVVGLGLAYLVSLPRNEKSSTQTEWVSVDPKSVSELSFRSAKSQVVLTRTEHGFFAKVDQADDSVKCDPAKEKCDEKRLVESFKVNKKVDDVLAGFNPLYVLRTLGKADKLNLAEFGLKEPSGNFELKAGGKTVVAFMVGKKSYGSRNVFAIDSAKQEVLLLNGDGIEDVEKARSRLFQREMVDTDFDSVTGARLIAAGGEKQLAHTKRDGGGELIWTDPNSDQVKPAYKNFMSQVEKIVVQKYASDDDAKEVAMLTPFVSVVLRKGDKDLVTIQLFKRVVGAETTYWAHSTDLDAYAQVNNARVEGLEKDLPSLMGK